MIKNIVAFYQLWYKSKTAIFNSLLWIMLNVIFAGQMKFAIKASALPMASIRLARIRSSPDYFSHGLVQIAMLIIVYRIPGDCLDLRSFLLAVSMIVLRILSVPDFFIHQFTFLYSNRLFYCLFH